MQLAHARLVGIPPFSDVTFPFVDDDGKPRGVTVVHGGGGVGKTTLLAAIATTRPGHAVVQPRRVGGGDVPFVICDWLLDDDDPERPHPLRVVTPNVKLGDDEGEQTLQRREQALFDRRAREGGFVCLTISAMRWFSRQPVGLSAPARTVARYDVRTTTVLDDASRSDLTRETKQALAYAAISGALAGDGPPTTHDPRMLADAMHDAVDRLVQLAGFSYRGLDPRSFEPMFSSPGGGWIPFDAMPTRARHLVAFAALPARTLWAAYHGRDPRTAQGVVVIDEVDLHQDPGVQANLVPALRSALPRVQWVLTTTSPTVAASCAARDVLALRRLPETSHIELFVGAEAQTH